VFEKPSLLIASFLKGDRQSSAVAGGAAGVDGPRPRVWHGD
jgi:hypothetical protein